VVFVRTSTSYEAGETPYEFDFDADAILNGYIASITSLSCDLPLGRYQEFKGRL
jgi:hypothetical protein